MNEVTPHDLAHSAGGPLSVVAHLRSAAQHVLQHTNAVDQGTITLEAALPLIEQSINRMQTLLRTFKTSSATQPEPDEMPHAPVQAESEEPVTGDHASPIRRLVASSTDGIDVTPYAPHIMDFMRQRGISVRMLEVIDPPIEERLMEMGGLIGDSIQNNPLMRILLDMAKRSLNLPPLRVRRFVTLRRLAGRSLDELARRMNLPLEDVRLFERTGRGLTDEQSLAAQCWWYRLTSNLGEQELAQSIGVTEDQYRHFERTGEGLDEAQRRALDMHLGAASPQIGEALYAVTPLRRLVQRYDLSWDDAIARLGLFYCDVVRPLIDSGLLDGVRVSPIGSMPTIPNLPDSAWIARIGQAGRGEPSPDVLLHVWVSPDSLSKRFLTGGWLTYYLLRRLRTMANEVEIPTLETLHDIVVEVPYRDQRHQTMYGIIAAWEHGVLGMEGLTARQTEDLRTQFRRIRDLMAPSIGEPQRTIAVTSEWHATADIGVTYGMTVVGLDEVDAAIRRAFTSTAC